MRIIPGAVRLSRPPRVVGKTTQDIEQGVDLQAVVTANVDPTREFKAGNANTPGSPAYVAARDADADLQAELASRNATTEFISREEGRAQVVREEEVAVESADPLVPHQAATRRLTVEQWLVLAESLAQTENPAERALVLLGEEGVARAMDRAAALAQDELASLSPLSVEVLETAEEEEPELDADEAEAEAEHLDEDFSATVAQAMLAELSEMYTPSLVTAVLDGRETGAELTQSIRALVEEAPLEATGELSKETEVRVRSMLREFLEQDEEVAEPVEEVFESEEEEGEGASAEEANEWAPRAFAGAQPRASSQAWSTPGPLGARPLEKTDVKRKEAMSVLEKLARDFGAPRDE
ncbi:hypothetical protein HDZ31DRAFT_40282 [Schizophyllum fasciatum]